MSLDEDRKIILDIGGTVYHTTDSTLLSVKDQYFHGMSNYDDLKGYIFVDRDGTYFNHILNYMRYGPDWSPNLLEGYPKGTIRQIVKECDFYGLDDMKTSLQSYLEKQIEKDSDEVRSLIRNIKGKNGMDGMRGMAGYKGESGINGCNGVDGKNWTDSQPGVFRPPRIIRDPPEFSAEFGTPQGTPGFSGINSFGYNGTNP
jgi:hypothetical protein